MIYPDYSNYVLDDFSYFWGAYGAFGVVVIGYFLSSIIKSVFKFARWYITRKNLRKSSADVIKAFEEFIDREDG